MPRSVAAVAAVLFLARAAEKAGDAPGREPAIDGRRVASVIHQTIRPATP